MIIEKEGEEIVKKFLIYLLCAAMALSLCACAGEKPEESNKTLQAGFGRADITPNYSVPLSGYGRSNQRMSAGFIDKLYATCIALRDPEGSTVLLITMDLVCAFPKMIQPVRQKISAATGVPQERIMLHGTHTHSAPEVYSSLPIMERYRMELFENVTKAAVAAMEDLAPATLETGKAYTENLTFVRHYTVSDGSVYGDNFGKVDAGERLTGHVHEADEEMRLVRFCREEKQDILLMNYQSHPKMAGTSETGNAHNRLSISADYVGTTREYVEKNGNVLFAFFLGASGNLNNYSKIPGETRTNDYKEYGKLLGDVVLSCMESMTPAKEQKITFQQKVYDAVVDHSEDYLAEAAQKVVDRWNRGATYTEAVEAGGESAIISPYHASSILLRKGMTAPTEALELNAIGVGDIGFVTAPYEMFDTNGKAIREASPFDTTIVISCANGAWAYLADEAAFSYYSYEACNRRFPKGTAEEIADTLAKMLQSLKNDV